LNSTQLAIITNTELLAFSQDDTVSAPAKPFTPSGASMTSPPSYYAGSSAKGVHVAILNTGSSTSTMGFDFVSVPGLSGSSFKVHDMWTGKDVGTFSGKYSVALASHDTAAYLITPA
jgi:alpha-galactosidase